MIKKLFNLSFLGFYSLIGQTTDPMITKWLFNTTNQTYAGANGTFIVNVEAVYYTSSLVYVKSTGVPSYYTDNQSLFNAKDMTNVFKLPRTQTVATTATRTYLRDEGAVGVLIDGSVILSPCDGKSYNNAGVWHQLAYKFEGNDFDSTYGHSTPQGQYHHHVAVNSSVINSLTDSTTHSPLIGYAFDGYPVYGPFGYTNTDGTGAITRMKTSWQIRNITSRTTLPDGSTASSAGPSIGNPPSGQPLGKYFEDYEYVSDLGHLDQYNGRFCITPEYPSGTYCYFTTLDSSLLPEFPYFIGDYMYGVVQSGNMGPSGGNNTVPGTATQYTPTSLNIEEFNKIQMKVYPNPASEIITVSNNYTKNYIINIFDVNGKLLKTLNADENQISINISEFNSGIYIIEVKDPHNNTGLFQKIIKK